MAEQQVDLDSLAAKLAKLVTGGKSSHGVDDLDDLDDGRGGTVPKWRFQKLVDKNRALQSALDEAGTLLEQLQTGHKAALDELKANAAEQVKGIATQHSENLSLVEMGLNDQIARQTARTVFDSLPKTGRPASVVDWWKGVTEAQAAHLADPEKAEAPQVAKVLTPFLPQAPADGGGSKKPPAGGGGGATFPNGPGPSGGSRPDYDTAKTPEELIGMLSAEPPTT